MKYLRRGIGLTVGLIIAMGSLGTYVQATSEGGQACDMTTSGWCIAPRLSPSVDIISGATMPKLATPDWFNPPVSTAPREVTYSISTRGTISADIDGFRSVVAATYADGRGWARLGVAFREVETGGQFTVFLSEASQMTTFSSTGCDTTYSCNVGRAVIINQDRWEDATPAWMGGGGDLASYRQMVINHETGHWLGHGHRTCSAAGQAAPIMQQQSMSLQGCTLNAWPLSSEMYSPTLGIRS